MAPAPIRDERVDWSALMDAHGIEPDAERTHPAVTPPARGPEASRSPGRLLNAVVALVAVFSIAASAAVLIALLRGQGVGERVNREPVLAPPPPAAFQQSTDGVAVVPPPST